MVMDVLYYTDIVNARLVSLPAGIAYIREGWAVRAHYNSDRSERYFQTAFSVVKCQTGYLAQPRGMGDGTAVPDKNFLERTTV